MADDYDEKEIAEIDRLLAVLHKEAETTSTALIATACLQLVSETIAERSVPGSIEEAAGLQAMVTTVYGMLDYLHAHKTNQVH
jgi:hypothetical protein